MESNIHAKPHNAAQPALTKPISIRLTQEEYQQLKVEVGDLSLSAHIRKRLFSNRLSAFNGTTSDCGQRLTPQMRQKLLAQILMQLGKLETVHNVNSLLNALQSGLIEASPELCVALEALHVEIKTLRHELLKALGLRP